MSDSPISRSNFSANSVLTSTDLNSQLNTVYDRVNDLDGVFLKDDTVTAAKLVDGISIPRSIVSKTTTYTITSSDDIVTCDASGGAFTVTLPAAASNTGLVLLIKKTDNGTNAVTVDGNGSETIDGSTTIALPGLNNFIEVVSDGTNWVISAKQIADIYQIKYLSADVVGTASDISDLRFALSSNKVYEVKLQMRATSRATSGQATMEANYNSSPFGLLRQETESDDSFALQGTFILETTTASNLTIDFSESGGSSSGILRGDGGHAETWVEVRDVTGKVISGTVA